MADFDWGSIHRGKVNLLAKYASLAFGEKLSLLDRLYERDHLMQGAARRHESSQSVDSSSKVAVFLSSDGQEVQGTIRVITFGAADSLVASVASRGNAESGTDLFTASLISSDNLPPRQETAAFERFDNAIS
jgi:hypothetical protein